VHLAVLALVAVGAHPPGSSSDDPVDVASASSTVSEPNPHAEASVKTIDVPAAEAAAGPTDAAARLQSENGSRRVVAQLFRTRTEDFGLLGVTWEKGSAAEDLRVEVRTRTGEEWTSWEDVEVEDLGPAVSEASRDGTSPVWVGDSDGVAVRLLSAAEAPKDVEVVLVDGGTGLARPGGLESDSGLVLSPVAATYAPATANTTDVADATATSTGSKVAPKPAILTRKQWGVDTSHQVECSAPKFVSASKGVVLHHTAGANGYTREQAPGIVRGIHLYHTRSLGWCDVGYNFLVDAYGTIYAGRRGGQERQVRGSHAGNWDVNLYTTGIAMIGNFETIPVPEATKDAVRRLSAWRLSYFGLDALGKATIAGKSIDIISGHRDVYSAGIRPATATACPGKYGYEWLTGGMRNEVQALIDAAPVVAEPTPTPTPEPEPEPTPEPLDPVMSRLAGDSRYATAAKISEGSFDGRGGTVFLSSGETFPDALSGGPAAATQVAPILLSRQRSLPAETAAELERLAPSRIYVLGGEGALSERVVAQAATYTDRVTRLAGSDRYSTGVEISRALWSHSDMVYVASGASYPDALSGGALAARNRAPILLADRMTLPEEVEQELIRLRPRGIVLLGGTAALSKALRDEIAQVVPGASVSRLSGKNRYATSAAITRAGWASSERAYFAAGAGFPDALAGVPASALRGAPLLLTQRTCMPAPIARTVDQLDAHERILLGGSVVLDDRASSEAC
jgi:putative cell wall-binding protein